MANIIQFIRNVRGGLIHGGSWFDILLFIRWRNNLRPGVDSVSRRLPWLSIRAVDFLNREIRPEFSVFEYGGGGSTLFWNSRVRRLVTVEHDATWFSILKGKLESELKCEWTGIFIEPSNGDLVNKPDAAEPEHYTSMDAASRGRNYKDYVKSILQFSDESFDIILIDGRCRTSCIRDAFPKLKIGGLLVLDNAEREYYSINNESVFQKCRIELMGMGPVYFSPQFSETKIYRRIE